MRRTPVLVAAFGLAMLAIAQASAPAPQAYPIVRVIDGDTVVVKINDQDTTVRLIGVAVPVMFNLDRQAGGRRFPVCRYGSAAELYGVSKTHGSTECQTDGYCEDILEHGESLLLFEAHHGNRGGPAFLLGVVQLLVDCSNLSSGPERKSHEFDLAHADHLWFVSKRLCPGLGIAVGESQQNKMQGTAAGPVTQHIRFFIIITIKEAVPLEDSQQQFA